MHEVLVNRLGGLSLPRKSVVRLTDRPDMTLDVYRGRKTTIQQQQHILFPCYRDGIILDIGTDDEVARRHPNINATVTKIDASGKSVIPGI